MRKAKFAQSNNTEWKARGFKKSGAQQNECDSTAETNQPEERPRNTFRSPSQPKKSKRPQKDEAEKAPEDHSEPDLNQPAKKKTNATPQEGAVIKPKKNKKIPEGEGEGANAAEEAGNINQKRKKQKFQGYTLFIGNLSYDTTKEDIQNHFSKCGTIKNVRIPMDKDTNNPRGFGYIEVDEHVTYEKVLSLHHTFLKRRRINVECTFGGSKTSQKRKALIKEKTLKLRFLSREGKISSAKQRPWGKFTKKAVDG